MPFLRENSYYLSYNFNFCADDSVNQTYDTFCRTCSLPLAKTNQRFKVRLFELG